MDNIKQIKTGVAELLAIVLPNVKLTYKVYRGFFVMGPDMNDVDGKIKKIQRGDTKGFWRLPPGNWTPLGIDTELHELVCRELIFRILMPNTDVWFGYITEAKNVLVFSTAKEALASLMQANGINGPRLILKAI